MDWCYLYEALKATREERSNSPLTPEYKDRINTHVSSKYIEEMAELDIKEAVINYLKPFIE